MATNNWLIHAYGCSIRYGVPFNLLAGTVWAESEASHDFLGDLDKSSGPAPTYTGFYRALGYGQVWPLWWPEHFEAACLDLGKTFYNQHDYLVKLVQDDPWMSMAVAAKAVRYYWNQAQKNVGGTQTFNTLWASFTRGYVGPQIPDWDFNRRLGIMNSYLNITSPSNTEVSQLIPSIWGNLPTEN